MKKITRNQPLWFFYILHRVSGLVLALFLPVHFWVLALALNEPELFDQFVKFTKNPLVKLSEAALMFLLCSHFLGGLRLLVLENFPWRSRQKTAAAVAFTGSIFFSFLFLLQAV